MFCNISSLLNVSCLSQPTHLKRFDFSYTQVEIGKRQLENLLSTNLEKRSSELQLKLAEVSHDDDLGDVVCIFTGFGVDYYSLIVMMCMYENYKHCALTNLCGL